jgi:cell division protein ZapA (FtsZ GTPase activity inhibitor)
MAGRTVELTVAGDTYRVISTADEPELRRLAAMVEEKLAGHWQPGRPVTTRAMVLAALSLAHDVHEQRERANRIAERAREGVRSVLGRVDEALKETELLARQVEVRRRSRTRGGEPLPPVSSPSGAPSLRVLDGEHAPDET